MAEVSLRDLLGAGTHFGHQTRRWNPKMKEFIFTERNGIHIVDLQKTVDKIEAACKVVTATAEKGQPILFVGTKSQAKEIIAEEAQRCGMFYVTERWLGGMLTNWQTLRLNIRHLDNLDRISTDGTYEKLKKKEVLLLEKERLRMGKTLAGIRKMGRLPGLVFIVDVKKEHTAVREARKLEIPSVGIIDTNCDPEDVSHVIPGNDDAIRSIKLITHLMADAVIEGTAAKAKDDEEVAAGAAAPPAVISPAAAGMVAPATSSALEAPEAPATVSDAEAAPADSPAATAAAPASGEAGAK